MLYPHHHCFKSKIDGEIDLILPSRRMVDFFGSIELGKSVGQEDVEPSAVDSWIDAG